MSDNGAFEDGMKRFGRISDEDAERVLSGTSFDSAEGAAVGELVLFARALRASGAQAPDPALETALVPRLAEAAAASRLNMPQDAPRRTVGRGAGWRPRLALLGATVLLLPALMAGLAYAGVSLPEPAKAPFEALGIQLPNQSGGGIGAAMSHGRGERSDDPSGSTPRSAEPGSEGNSGAGEPGDDKKHDQGNRKSKGKAHGNDNANSQGHGASGSTPSGDGGVPPGHGGVPPGGGSGGSTGPPQTPPGQGGVSPGQGEPK